MVRACRARVLVICGLGCLVLAGAVADAHPLAPGLLVLREDADGRFAVSWKIPLRREPGSSLTPVLPAKCRTVAPELAPPVREGLGVVRRWNVDCGQTSLAGETLRVDGLESKRAGVLVRVEFSEGRSVSRMLRSDAPSFRVPAGADALGVFRSFLALGVEHLISGIDHVLFVVALTLIVGWGRRLIWTVSLFTVGHSMTLSAAVLGFVNFPSAPMEALISLSVVVAAAELARPDPRAWLRRVPWLMAGGFGLLHGMGFAGALAEVGLPAGEIPLALAAFNIGIELGQLAVVGVSLAVWGAVRRFPWPTALRPIPGYAMGTLAAVWFWQRLAILPLG